MKRETGEADFEESHSEMSELLRNIKEKARAKEREKIATKRKKDRRRKEKPVTNRVRLDE